MAAPVRRWSVLEDCVISQGFLAVIDEAESFEEAYVLDQAVYDKLIPVFGLQPHSSVRHRILSMHGRTRPAGDYFPDKLIKKRKSDAKFDVINPFKLPRAKLRPLNLTRVTTIDRSALSDTKKADMIMLYELVSDEVVRSVLEERLRAEEDANGGEGVQEQ